jgi:GMP synthase-like glutamine amidotransferase
MILILNNYAENETVQQIVEAVQQYTNVPIEVISFKQVKEIDSNKTSCLILSGSRCNLSDKEDEKKYVDEIELVKALQAPLLGICFGHHILGRAYATEILRGKWIKKTEKVKILASNELFSSWDTGNEITVEESHGDYIKEPPRGFTSLARSESCRI